MQITREYLISIGICEQGLSDFDEAFPLGVASSDDFVSASYHYDERDGHNSNSTFCRQVVIELKKSKLTYVWEFYCPKNKEILTFNTKEEAIRKRTESFSQITYTDTPEIFNQYSILVETISTNGDSITEVIYAKDL